MTPKEKAKYLVDRYYWIFGDGYLGEQHIQSALIAVDEIVKSHTYGLSTELKNYWQEVKQEILAL